MLSEEMQLGACIAVNFDNRAVTGAVILDHVRQCGLQVLAMRLIPCADGIACTFMLDVGVDSWTDFDTCAEGLRTIPGIGDVIPSARPRVYS